MSKLIICACCGRETAIPCDDCECICYACGLNSVFVLKADVYKELISSVCKADARVAELESQVDYYERLEAFIEQFEPRIVDDAREYIIKTQKEASHE